MTTLGIAGELARSRHWDSIDQLVAWGATGLLGIALALVAGSPSAGHVRAARPVLAAVGVSAVVGTWQHLRANLASGPLDFRYATTWSGFSTKHRWWLAVSGGVGAAPPLVPLLLGMAAAMVWLAIQDP